MRFIWEQGYDRYRDIAEGNLQFLLKVLVLFGNLLYICLYNPKTRNEWIRFIGHIECCLVTYPLILSVISMMR